MKRREAIKSLGAIAGTACFGFSRAADPNPSRPIRIVLPAAAGGAADRYARLVANGLSESLKQSVIVDNKPGAGGNIGADLVAKAAPDGYTLLFGSSNLFALNPYVYRKLSYDAMRDFIPIAPVVKGFMYLFVSSTSSATDLTDWIRMAKARNGGMTYGTPGIGSAMHVAMEWLKHQAGIDLLHVPYKGGTPNIVTALIGGEIDAAFDFYTPVMAQVKAGKLKALAITSPSRNPVVPDIPTFAEHGVPGLEMSAWGGIFAPAGTPKSIVDQLNVEIAKVRAGQDVQRTIANAGAVELKGTSEEFKAFVKQDYQQGAQLVKTSGATLE